MLHLFTHAFFKACLFLSAGTIIHALHQAQHHRDSHFDVQDLRNMGGLRKKMPFTFIIVLISGSALAGIPFFSGFVSKDAILSALSVYKGDVLNWRWLVFAGAFVVSFITVVYTFRMIAAVFMGAEKSTTTNLQLHEPSWVMRLPMVLLASCSVFFIVSFNPFDFSGWLFQSLQTKATMASHQIELVIFSAVWVLLAVAVAWWSQNKITFTSIWLKQAFMLDNVYQIFIVKPSLVLANRTTHADKRWIDGAIHSLAYVQVTIAYLAAWFDRFVIDGLVNGMAKVSMTMGSFTRSFQGGNAQRYILWSVLSVVFFLIWVLFLK